MEIPVQMPEEKFLPIETQEVVLTPAEQLPVVDVVEPVVGENEVQDVMVLARQKVQCKNYKLLTVVKALNLTLDNAHRAFFDALATAEVLLELSKAN